MPNKTHQEFVNDARNKSTVIALIYSPVELYEYLVEIISEDSSKFIHTGSQIKHFDSVDHALAEAANYQAVEYYLCVDNTYDECGSGGLSEKFDYIPIHCKYKH